MFKKIMKYSIIASFLFITACGGGETENEKPPASQKATWGTANWGDTNWQ